MNGFEHYGWAWIAAFAAIIVLALYRRGRRLIGHQRFVERRILLRSVIFAILIIVLLYSYVQRGNDLEAFASVAAGFVIGAGVALFSLRLTRMGRDEGGIWYVPNLYLGIGLIALLVARYVYEYVVVLPKIRHAAATGATGVPAHPGSTLISHGILFVVLGYYVVYYLGIYFRGRRLESEQTQDNNTGN